MKIKKLSKNQKRGAIVATGVVLLGLAGGSYYFYTKQKAVTTDSPVENNTSTTEDEVQQNIQTKSDALSGETTTTPSVVAETPATTSIADVSLSVYKNGDEAIVSFYGPFGTFSVEKLVGGTWTTLVEQFQYSGRGGRNIDTMTAADGTSHYRISKVENGTRVATSGDTTISWQEILSKGTFTVPLAE